MQTIFKQGFKKVLIEEIITKLIDDLFTKRDSINTEVQSKVEVMVKDLILKLFQEEKFVIGAPKINPTARQMMIDYWLRLAGIYHTQELYQMEYSVILRELS